MNFLILFWIVLLLIAVLVIVWGADTVLDNLAEIGKNYHLSPLILALLIMGVDLEELIASVTAASAHFPEVAIGNVIGNSIISLTFIFALPALFRPLKLTHSSFPLLLVMVLLFLNILISILLPTAIGVCGLIALMIFLGYVIYAFKNLKEEILEEHEEEEIVEKIELQKTFSAETILEDEGIGRIIANSNQNQDSLHGTTQDSMRELRRETVDLEEPTWKSILYLIIGLAVLYGGAELLVYCIGQILILSNLQESFIGLVIVAAGTNVEEYTLLFKSIQKDRAELGVVSLIGKIIWNLGVTFGVSAIIIWHLPDASLTLLATTIFSICVILPYFIFLAQKQREIRKKDAIILLILFGIFLILSIL